MRCIYCGRFFSEERIEKHQNICGNLKNARPKGLDGQPTQTGAKVFDAKAQRIGGGSAFVSREMYEKRVKDREKEVKKDMAKAKEKSSWRKQHEDFVNACRAGRGEEVQPSTREVSRAGQLQCHHCGRWFSEEAAERHIPICAKVVNRPKPPPSPARPPSHRGEASPKPRNSGRSPAPRGDE
ncbi:Zc2hc1c, partial [Symbiodinium microadriaticum]